MPDAIQILIADLKESKYSAAQQNIIVPVDDFVAALNEIEGAIGPGAVSSVTNTDTYLTIAPNTGPVVANVDLATLGPALNIPAGHNPTATASDTAVNGAATTFMRSDGAPAIQKCSNAQFGLCEVDGTTIISTGGLISAVTSGLPPGDIVLPNGQILVGNVANVAAAVAVSGDATISNAGVVSIPRTSNAVFGLCEVDGTTITAIAGVISAAAGTGSSGANPSATAGPAANNGVSANFMRADASPAVQLGSAAQAGLLQGDGSTVSIAAGVISVPAATSSQQGGVTVDNISIHINGNKISTGFLHAGFAAGRYYPANTLLQGGSFAAYTANVLRVAPFYVPYPTTFTRIAIDSNSASGNVEFGIYNVANGVPSSLLYDLGSHALSIAVIEITGLSIVLPAGTYAIGVATDGSANFPVGNPAPQSTAFLGSPGTGAGITATGWTGAWVYSAGALPGTFPSPAFNDGATCPMVFLKL